MFSQGLYMLTQTLVLQVWGNTINKAQSWSKANSIKMCSILVIRIHTTMEVVAQNISANICLKVNESL